MEQPTEHVFVDALQPRQRFEHDGVTHTVASVDPPSGASIFCAVHCTDGPTLSLHPSLAVPVEVAP